MSEGRWEHFCVVGIGGHARTKLIPAIAANGQALAGIVTRKSAVELGPAVPRFASVAEAAEALPRDTAFMIASPPQAHFDQVMTALAAGHDVIVEKPAFVTAAEAGAAIAAAQAAGALLIEGFMNRHTALHRRFLADLERLRPVRIDFTFTIPQAPQGTFRSDPAIGASNLYDMGCYLLGALSDAGLPLDGLALERVEHVGQPDRELLHLAGAAGGIALRALIGVDTEYVNRLTLTVANGDALAYSPFIYGRLGERLITTMTGGETREERLNDKNAFEAMFAVPRAAWRESQAERSTRILDLAAQLERLGATLATMRAV